MDLICRCIIASFQTPSGINRDTRLTVVLEGPPDPPMAIQFDGSRMDRAPVGELAAAELILGAMAGKPVAGINASRKTFEETVSDYRAVGFSPYYLHEEGEDALGLRFEENPVFILGDQKGLDPASEKFLDKIRARRVSLGPYSYLASHCITLVQSLKWR